MSARRLGPRLAAVLWVVSWCGCGPNGQPRPASPGKPVRIASLTLATDEILVELVPLERIVAVTHLADDPEVSNVAGRYPREILRTRDTSPEPIIALAPDLVCVASYNTADSLELLARSGLTIYRNEAVDSLDQIEAGLERLGARVGEPERSRTLVAQMQGRRKRLADVLQSVADRPRVLFWSAGFTSGRDTTIDDVIREAGGVNVARELELKGSAEIAPERVVAADPEFVLVAQWKSDDRQGQIANHAILRRLRAVRENRVVAIESRYLTSLSHHVLEGAERLARALHPEKFAGGVSP